ncbi:MAG: acyltransferase, partial [Acidimicrobiales bacterium]
CAHDDGLPPLVSSGLVASVRRRVHQLERHVQSVRSTRRTSLWEVRARPAPDGTAFRSLGARSIVVPPAGINRPHLVSIGDDVLLHEGISVLVAEAAAGIEIGDGTVLSRYAHVACAERVTIGRQVSSSDHIAILDSWGPIDEVEAHPLPPAPVSIGDGAYLGFGCIVGPGVTIGEGAFVGEGAVVLDDVPAHTVVYGNPAVANRRWSTSEGWTGARFP